MSIFQDKFYENVLNPASIYLLKVINGNAKTTLCKVKNRDFRTMSLTSFWCLYCKLWTSFTYYLGISLVNLEHINPCWEGLQKTMALLQILIFVQNLNSFMTKVHISYRNRNKSIDLLWKWMDWFLYDMDFRHERVIYTCITYGTKINVQTNLKHLKWLNLKDNARMKQNIYQI